jgi:hypothetical protein
MTTVLVPYHLDEYLPDLAVPVETETPVRVDLAAGDPCRDWQS